MFFTEYYIFFIYLIFMSELQLGSNDLKIIEFEDFTDKKNKINFKIVNSDDNIEFFAEMKELNPPKQFYLKENENDLMKNSYLLTGKNIQGIFKMLENHYIKRKNHFIIEQNDSIILTFDIDHLILKKVDFILSEIKKKQDPEFITLSKYVYKTLTNEIKNLKEQNLSYEKRITELENIILELKDNFNNNINNNNINNNENNNKNKIQEKNNNNRKISKSLTFNHNDKNLLNFNPNNVNINEKSNLSKNLEEKNKTVKIVRKQSIFDSNIDIDENLIKTWLNKKQFKAKLLYRMSEESPSFGEFHNKCDNKGITITFIETTKGMKFGGYTELDWDLSETNKSDKSTFLFSFNNKEKYEKINEEYSISCTKNDGPKFGWGPQICFNNNLKRGKSIKSDRNTFVLDNKFVNDTNWETKELEVYKIKYI